MPHRYPQEAVLRDGRRVLIRPFTANDVGALYDFFHTLPNDYKRFAWDLVDNRALIESWGRNIDYGKVFPLWRSSVTTSSPTPLCIDSAVRCAWLGGSSGCSIRSIAGADSAPLWSIF